MNPKASAIIPAAGFGSRMQLDHPKQYHLLGSIPILARTVQAFLDHPYIEDIIVVVAADKIELTRDLFYEFQLNSSLISIIAGGDRRQDSVLAGLKAVPGKYEIVLVHDAARPLVDQETITRCYLGAVEHGAAIAAVQVNDTLKKSDKTRRVTATVDRDGLWQAQTPQAARKDLLQEAFEANGNISVTDESSLLERLSIPVIIVNGAETNFKITRPEDLLLAETIISQNDMQARHIGQIPTMRIGHGYDAHRFAEKRKLVLAGVTIPHDRGLAGHSDADVLTHALCDAILGALGEGDIGRHFPDNNELYKDIFSIELLKKIMALADSKGYILGNADITVVCQAPKLASHIDNMKTVVAQTCKTQPAVINIKATTTEKMGFAGRQEGISCHAVVLLHLVPST